MSEINVEYVNGLWNRQQKVDQARALIQWYLPWLVSQTWSWVNERMNEQAALWTYPNEWEIAKRAVFTFGPIAERAWIVSRIVVLPGQKRRRFLMKPEPEPWLEITLCHATSLVVVAGKYSNGTFEPLHPNQLTISELFAVVEALPKMTAQLCSQLPKLKERRLDIALTPNAEVA